MGIIIILLWVFTPFIFHCIIAHRIILKNEQEKKQKQMRLIEYNRVFNEYKNNN